MSNYFDTIISKLRYNNSYYYPIEFKLKNVDENNMDDVINNIANTLIPRNILFKHYDKIFRMVWIQECVNYMTDSGNFYDITEITDKNGNNILSVSIKGNIHKIQYNTDEMWHDNDYSSGTYTTLP